MERATRQISIDGELLEVYVLDSSDASTEANILFQAVCLHSEWIANVKPRFFPEAGTRKDWRARLQLGVALVLQQAQLDRTQVERLAGELTAAVDRLTPGLVGEDAAGLPDEPKADAIERLARAYEARRTAVSRLLQAVLVNESDEALVRKLADKCKDERILNSVLDTVMG